ncbi:family 1 glycosylhydrolase [Tsuneonella sp. HG249]
MQTFPIQAWGGAECTVCRIGDGFRDQLIETGHDGRASDFDLIASLGLQAVRFPILWERVSPDRASLPDWRWSDHGLSALHRHGVGVIAGLVHHGSGPHYTSLIDPDFASGLAEHAKRVVGRYPWIRDWTPVNEPLTTARFSALYGHWYPHLRNEGMFWTALLNQIDATRLSMKAVRRIQPSARLIQTDDLGRTYATGPLASQAEFENTRRWMTWDLLCGEVQPGHALWSRLRRHGLEERLRAIADDPCPPDIIGINHYLTSDRFLDHRVELYDPAHHGGNGEVCYSDVEAVRVLEPPPNGLRRAIDDAWARYRRPIALTEVHNGCTREEQVRWLDQAWSAAREAVSRGVDMRAVTAWSLFGSQGWDTLLTRTGTYEPGAFDVSSGVARETALAQAVRAKSAISVPGAGWWQRPLRLTYPAVCRPAARSEIGGAPVGQPGPVLIIGSTGTLGQALARECLQRDLDHLLVGRDRLNLLDTGSIARSIDDLAPRAVVNAAGWVRVDDAEAEPAACFAVNTDGAVRLARLCSERGIPTVNFSSDLVFCGSASRPYVEDDTPKPLGAYGASKAAMEEGIAALPGANLVIRTAAFFQPHDQYNFAVACANALLAGRPFEAVEDAIVSPTYVPDLCRAVLDLLIDGETGLWHLANGGEVSWCEFARSLAEATGLPADLVRPVSVTSCGWAAPRPRFSALASNRGRLLPPIESAIDRFATGMAAIQPADHEQEILTVC